MKKLVALLMLSAFLVPVASSAASARDFERAGYHRGHEYHRPQPPQPRGYWHTGWHNGKHGRWWVVGNSWHYYPVRPAPVYYHPRPAPVVMAPMVPVSTFWFGFKF